MNNKVKQINLRNLICQGNGFVFIKNDNIVTKVLWKYGLHFFNRGKNTLANNFINHLRDKFLKDKTESNKKVYCNQRNICVNILRNAKLKNSII